MIISASYAVSFGASSTLSQVYACRNSIATETFIGICNTSLLRDIANARKINSQYNYALAGLNRMPPDDLLNNH